MNTDDPFQGLQTDLPLHWALPGWAVDAISQGSPNPDGRVVWGKCVSIAMSARRRGWSEHDFVNAIAGDGSKLWDQLRRRSNGKLRGDQAAYKDLGNAWVVAAENLSDTGLRTGADLASDALELAYEWQDYLAEAACSFSAVDRSVMLYVAGQTEQRKLRNVTCPRAHVAELAGVSLKAARLGLDRLTEGGFLIKVSPGRRSSKPENRRAAIYRLSQEVRGPKR
jgi:hypothetical protein